MRAGLASPVLLELLIIFRIIFHRCGGGLTGFYSLRKNYSIVHVPVAYCAGFVYIQCITYNWAGYKPGFITFNLITLLATKIVRGQPQG